MSRSCPPCPLPGAGGYSLWGQVSSSYHHCSPNSRHWVPSPYHVLCQKLLIGQLTESSPLPWKLLLSHFTNEETGTQNVEVIRIQIQPADEIPKLELLSTIVKASGVFMVSGFLLLLLFFDWSALSRRTCVVPEDLNWGLKWCAGRSGYKESHRLQRQSWYRTGLAGTTLHTDSLVDSEAALGSITHPERC